MTSQELESIFDSIIARTGIDLALVEDPERIWNEAFDCYWEKALEYAEAQGPLGDEDERKLLAETAELLEKRLHKLFHEK